MSVNCLLFTLAIAVCDEARSVGVKLPSTYSTPAGSVNIVCNPTMGSILFMRSSTVTSSPAIPSARLLCNSFTEYGSAINVAVAFPFTAFDIMVTLSSIAPRLVGEYATEMLFVAPAAIVKEFSAAEKSDALNSTPVTSNGKVPLLRNVRVLVYCAIMGT